jgi:hypothetical protein
MSQREELSNDESLNEIGKAVAKTQRKRQGMTISVVVLFLVLMFVPMNEFGLKGPVENITGLVVTRNVPIGDVAALRP